MRAMSYLTPVNSVGAAARKTAAALCLATGLVAGGVLQAAVLQVSPVRVEFDNTQRAQALQVANSGQRDLEAQVRVMRWTQENGEDRLVPADDLVVSPAILRVAPGKQQIVRLVRTDSAPPAQERSYRVFVDELPSTQSSAAGAGLRVLMRYSIPVFIAPPETAPAARQGRGAAVLAPTDLSRVRAQWTAGSAGQGVLRVKNDGARALRISYLSTLGPGEEKRSLGNGLIGYVLPGQQMGWPVNLPYPLPAGLSLKARFNDDRQARPLPME